MRGVLATKHSSKDKVIFLRKKHDLVTAFHIQQSLLMIVLHDLKTIDRPTITQLTGTTTH